MQHSTGTHVTEPEQVATGVERIQLAHGAGGRMMQRLISDVICRHLGSAAPEVMDDAAELHLERRQVAFTTDTFVVQPVFFAGGDIGSLAVSGTVNDLLMKGARPAWLSLGLVLEEGLPLSDLERVLASIAATCRDAEVRVVTGDTKVVGRGDADRIFINTTGLGPVLPGVRLGGGNARPGDAVLVSGSLGRHGVAVMAARGGLKLSGDICSDAAPLAAVVLPLLERLPGAFHVLRDPTRGGVATTLGEIAAASGVSIRLDEVQLPVDEPVHAVCELLGFDPLYLPCEGRFLAIVTPDAAENILSLLRGELDCPHAARIGTVGGHGSPEVWLNTATGGRRILDMPAGELLPRIC